MDYLKKKDLEECKLEALTPENKERVIKIKDGIQLNQEYTLGYGIEASRRLSDFSTDLLNSIKLKDSPEVEGIITELMTGLNSIDPNTLMENKGGLFSRIFGKSKNEQLSTFVAKYDTIQKVIDKAKVRLEEANFSLKKDIEMCGKNLSINLEYIKELDMYIMAGKLKSKEEHEKLDMESLHIDSSDVLEVQDFNIRKNELERFDRKLHDLFIVREVAIQNIPQLMLIQDGDGILIEKIQTSINSAIPLWESQMMIAITLVRQKGALQLQQQVRNTTNKLLERNSEMLKSGSIEIAKELETGIVDVEVLKKCSNNLIETLTEIKDIRANGAIEREKVENELQRLQTSLGQKLIELKVG